MRKLPGKVLVIDIEATCWEKAKDQPPGAKNEVIEFGIVPVLMSNLTMGIPVSILVRPKTCTVSDFCTKITTITQDMVEKSPSYKKACKKLIEDADSKNVPWISWGEYDKKQIIYQCQFAEVSYPFGAGHWNLQNMFSVMMGLDKEIGIVAALHLLGMEFEGTRHRAADEAYNISKVMIELFSRMRVNANG